MASLTFEQPLNELTRVNLRLEFLFKKIDENIGKEDYWSLRATAESIVQISHILDRPDIKSKFAKAIQNQLAYLEELSEQPGVDSAKLVNIINTLKELFQVHNQTGVKLAQALRDNHFLNTLRQHLLYPGGEADFELPAYQYWLQSISGSNKDRLQELTASLATVKETVTLLLKLTRSKCKEKSILAEHGFHQEGLDKNDSIQLIRIQLDKSANIYPIVSANNHRLNIRFYNALSLEMEEQSHENINFSLSCCT
jgi:cell division protein ZapD